MRQLRIVQDDPNNKPTSDWPDIRLLVLQHISTLKDRKLFFFSKVCRQNIYFMKRKFV